MAGTVVDTLISDAASAAGIAHVTPITGGALAVGVSSSPPSTSPMNGWQGHWDAAGFYVGSAIYDPLFYIKSDGTGVLPGLGLTATPNSTYTTWKIALRPGVKFHDGETLTGNTVVTNYKKRGLAVSFAVANIIKSVTASGNTVTITLAFPFFSFPYSLAEQQISYIASSNMCNGGTSVPTGTGAFKVSSWNLGTYGSTANLVANTSYWRQDSAGRKLPYLGSLAFKVFTDDFSRQSALTGGGCDMAVFYDGTAIKQNKTNSSLVKVDDFGGYREPAKTLILCNVKAATSPINDVRIRKALALSMNRATYLSGIDGGTGQVVDGIFRTGTYNYKNPAYPAYVNAASITSAKALVTSWKSAHGNVTPTVVMSYDSGSSAATAQFHFVQQAAQSVGITVNGATYDQATLINNVIGKAYEIAGWSQFGCVVPATNYVWFSSKGTTANFVNFSQLADPVVQTALLKAVAAKTPATAKTYWQTVNSQFAKDLPYLWLDTTVTQWAARSYVQNWQTPTHPTGTSVKSSAVSLSVHNGAIPDWAQVFR
jgi:peptide/nickel transport system substrate-binding protein